MAGASRVAYGRDGGLQARMLLTLFLLGVVYVGFVAVMITGGPGLQIALPVVVAVAAAQVFLSDKIALKALGAREVSPQEAPGLHALVERLCVQADLPKPRVAVADTQLPNAFAIGRSQRKATVCVTTGIMNALTPSELEGVIAHELAHVSNRDVLVMTIASFFATVALMIVQVGRLGRSFWGLALIGLIVYALSYVLLLALSRYRELAADRGAALITGRPSALASALLKISGAMKSVPKEDLRTAGEMNAFFIVPTRAWSALKGLFSTHPRMEKRIAKLSEIEAQLHGVPLRAGEADGLVLPPSATTPTPAPAGIAPGAPAAVRSQAFPDRSASGRSAGWPANWYPDPWQQVRWRYWDGRAWTAYTAG